MARAGDTSKSSVQDGYACRSPLPGLPLEQKGIPRATQMDPTGRMIGDLLAQARRMGGRDVILSNQGASVVDVFGVTHALTRAGKEISIRKEAFETLAALPRVASSAARDTLGIIHFDELGGWHLVPYDDRVVLRAHRPISPNIDSIVKLAAEDLERIRSLYRHGGVDIVLAGTSVQCHDAAMAAASELRHLGMRVDLDVERMDGTPSEAFRRREGFDDLRSNGRRWEVSFQAHGRLPASEPASDAVSRFLVMRGTALLTARAEWQRSHADRPSVFVLWERTGKTAEVTLNAKASVLKADAFETSPWERVTEIRSLRATDRDALFKTESSAPPLAPVEDGRGARLSDPLFDAMVRRALREQPKRAPSKLMHRRHTVVRRPQDEATQISQFAYASIQEAAAGFVDREKPRGYVPGRPLFFHGPAAFSIDNRTPIGALARNAAGEDVLLVQSLDGESGDRLDTVREAREALIAAAEGRLEVIEAPNLSEVAKILGHSLVTFAAAGKSPGPNYKELLCELLPEAFERIPALEGRRAAPSL